MFVIYLNMLNAATAWIEQGRVSPVPGLWWVHGVMAAFALGLLSAQNGWHRRLLR